MVELRMTHSVGEPTQLRQDHLPRQSAVDDRGDAPATLGLDIVEILPRGTSAL
jgi:hypothetical protein